MRTNSFGFLNGRRAGSGRGAVLRVLAQAGLLGRCGRVSWACGRASASHFYGKGTRASIGSFLLACRPTAGWSAPPHPTARARRAAGRRGACAATRRRPVPARCLALTHGPEGVVRSRSSPCATAALAPPSGRCGTTRGDGPRAAAALGRRALALPLKKAGVRAVACGRRGRAWFRLTPSKDTIPVDGYLG